MKPDPHSKEMPQLSDIMLPDEEELRGLLAISSGSPYVVPLVGLVMVSAIAVPSFRPAANYAIQAAHAMERRDLTERGLKIYDDVLDIAQLLNRKS